MLSSLSHFMEKSQSGTTSCNLLSHSWHDSWVLESCWRICYGRPLVLHGQSEAYVTFLCTGSQTEAGDQICSLRQFFVLLDGHYRRVKRFVLLCQCSLLVCQPVFCTLASGQQMLWRSSESLTAEVEGLGVAPDSGGFDWQMSLVLVRCLHVVSGACDLKVWLQTFRVALHLINASDKTVVFVLRGIYLHIAWPRYLWFQCCWSSAPTQVLQIFAAPCIR